MVDQGGPEKLEELLEDLQDEFGSIESLPEEVENLVQELRSGQDFLSRHHAADALGRIGSEYHQVQRALQAASESDPNAAVRRAAAQALRAWEEQEPSDEPEGQTKPEERAIAEQRRDALPRRDEAPPQLLVTSVGDAQHMSWTPPPDEKRRSALVGLGLLIVSIMALVCGLAGQFPRVLLPAGGALATGSGYWILAVMTSYTTVVASPDECRFSRGRWPLPNGRFYLRTRRLDPAACTHVWTEPVVTKRRKWSGGSGGGSDDVVVAIVEAVIEELFWVAFADRELVTTLTLHARTRDGEEMELLRFLSSERAEALQRMLQRLVDASSGSQAQGLSCFLPERP